MHLDLAAVRRVMEDKQLICVAKGVGGLFKVERDCAERYCVLCMSCASGVVFELWSVLSVIIFLYIYINT